MVTHESGKGPGWDRGSQLFHLGAYHEIVTNYFTNFVILVVDSVIAEIIGYGFSYPVHGFTEVTDVVREWRIAVTVDESS